MKVLLVYPEFPRTYWGFQYGLPIAGLRANLPPLGLVTVAALLPQTWEYRLVDRNIEELSDADLAWADVLMTGGMRVQVPSTRMVIARARAMGLRVVVGGPAISTDDTLFPGADVRVCGELEGILDDVLAAIESTETGLLVRSTEYPDIALSPTPRFDLLELPAYGAMSIQYSRGCPYRCEFCDIIQLFGRRPRTKSVPQVLAEMEALHALGHRGSIFYVDDNFIGNQRAVKELLPAVTAWQQARSYPFNLSTEASVNLASREPLISGMVDAGFNSVFLGIESPSPEALKEALKNQNLGLGAQEAVEIISRAGLEVMGGFIVGFDTDTPEIFAAQLHLIGNSPIPLAMVGLLMALPETGLWDRLLAEGRLRAEGSGDDGDQFGRPNFEPAMDEEALLLGYRKLLSDLYSAEAYYGRIHAFLDLCVELPGGGRKARPDEIRTLARIVRKVGIRSPRRRQFWRLMTRVVRERPQKFAWSLSRAIVGEHMIRYTQEDVLPRLDAALAQLARERAAA